MCLSFQANKISNSFCNFLAGIVSGVQTKSSEPGIIAPEIYVALEQIIIEQKKRPGIIDIQVRVNEGELSVGDDLLLIAVAGDIREHVIPVLNDTLNAVKAHVTSKTEHPA